MACDLFVVVCCFCWGCFGVCCLLNAADACYLLSARWCVVFKCVLFVVNDARCLLSVV